MAAAVRHKLPDQNSAAPAPIVSRWARKEEERKRGRGGRIGGGGGNGAKRCDTWGKEQMGMMEWERIISKMQDMNVNPSISAAF